MLNSKNHRGWLDLIEHCVFLLLLFLLHTDSWELPCCKPNRITNSQPSTHVLLVLYQLKIIFSAYRTLSTTTSVYWGRSFKLLQGSFILEFCCQRPRRVGVPKKVWWTSSLEWTEHKLPLSDISGWGDMLRQLNSNSWFSNTPSEDSHRNDSHQCECAHV